MDADRERTTPTATPPSLSLVIPAYNEVDRIAATVEAALAFLAAQPYRAELIVVDDGSGDATGAVATTAVGDDPAGRVLTIPHGGKAAALRAGMRAATMDQVAFSDADLATPLSYLEPLRAALAGGCDVAIGSREGVGARRLGEPFYRHAMGRVFNWLVRLLLLPGIQDTQCGFKLFRREAAAAILDRARLYADAAATVAGPRVTAFDVELLVVARRLGYRVCALPVVWTYGTRSKVHPARDTWQNVRDVLRVRVNAWRGRYRWTDVEGLARRIAEGHAYPKHVVDRDEFPDIPNREQFAGLIARVITLADATKTLPDGRRAYWQNLIRTSVIVDPNDPDGGTAFRPVRGRLYFDELD